MRKVKEKILKQTAFNVFLISPSGNTGIMFFSSHSTASSGFKSQFVGQVTAECL